MKNLFRSILVITLLSLSMLVSCKNGPKPDITAPKVVSNLNVTAYDGYFDVTWTDPDDKDFLGVKIYNANELEGRAATFADGILVGKGIESYKIRGLENGKSYYIRVTSIDVSLNESEVVYSNVVTFKNNPTTTTVYKYVCPKCKKEYNTAKEAADCCGVQEVEKIVNKYVCPRCGEVYSTTKEAMECCGAEEVIKEVEKEVYKYICPTCKKKYDNVDAAFKCCGPKEVEKIVEKDVYKYICPTCKKKYDTVDEASSCCGPKEVEVEKIVEKIVKKYVCPTCSSEYDTAAAATKCCSPVLPAINGVQAYYSSIDKAIFVSWETPNNGDLDHIGVRYKKGSGTETAKNAHLNSSYKITGIEPDNSEYTVSVYAVSIYDKAGAKTSVKVTASTGPSVSGITVSKDRIGYSDKSRNVTVTVSGINFASDTIVRANIYKGSTLISRTGCSMNSTHDKAIGTVSIPVPDSSLENQEVVYRIKAEVEGTVVSYVYKDVVVTPKTYVSSVELLHESLDIDTVTSDTTTVAVIKGVSLEAAESIKLQFYKGSELYGSSVNVTVPTAVDSKLIKVGISVPIEAGEYELRVLLNGVEQHEVAKLNLYGIPKFTSIVIPRAGVSAAGGNVTCTVLGSRFTTYNVDSSKFTISCKSEGIIYNGTVDILTDNSLNFRLNVPEKVGTYNISISYDSASISENYYVQDYSSYNIGDIILSDGSKVAYKENNMTMTDAQKEKAVAVVAGYNTHGAVIAVGMKGASYASWAVSGTVAYNTAFDKNWGSVTSGDKDGANNWAIICGIDPNANNKLDTEYIAYSSIQNYGSDAGLSGDYAKDWYLPTNYEMSLIAANIEIINKSLNLATGKTIRYAKYDKKDNGSNTIGKYNGDYYSMVYNHTVSMYRFWTSSVCKGDITMAFAYSIYDKDFYAMDKATRYELANTEYFIKSKQELHLYKTRTEYYVIPIRAF